MPDFLKLFLWGCLYVCACLCVHVCLPLRLLITSGMMWHHMDSILVTEFAKRGLIHTSNFQTLMRHNFICKQAIKLKFSTLLAQ